MRKTRWTLGAGALLLVFTTGSAAVVAQDDGEARERAETWAKMFFKPDAVDRFVAGWDLIALAPSSTDAILQRLQNGKLGNDSLVAASQTLGDMGSPDAAGPLARVARDPRQPSAVRIAALIAVAKIGGAEGTDQLAGFATEPGDADPTSQLMRCAAIVAMGMRGDTLPVPVVEKTLASDDPELRRAAFRAIGFVRDRRFVPNCQKGLQDEHPLVIAEAARSLGKINDPKSMDKVEALLKKNKNPAIRFLLIEALAWSARKSAIDELLSGLEDPGSHVQASSAGVLIDLGEKRAIPVFRKLLDESLGKRGSKDEQGTDARAAFALGALGDTEAGPVLVRALEQGTKEVRYEAAAALGKLRMKDGIPALKAALAQRDRDLRAVASIALGNAGDAATGDDLVAQLEDKDPVIRYTSCVGLGVLGNRRAIPSLQGVLQDDHDFVRRAAREAIARLQERPVVTPDPRDPSVLARLRALEREYVLRAELGRLFQAYNAFLGQVAQRTGPADVYAQVVVGYETVIENCGGSHPVVQRVPVTELRKVVDNSRARAEQARRNARDRASAGALTEDTQDRLEETYQLARLRADGDAELQAGNGSNKGAGGGGAGGATPTGGGKGSR